MGKVNAAINMIAALSEKKPNLLINFGTAGAIKTGLADIVEVGQSVQCEMDARPLGIALGATAFETETERFTLSDSPIICGTAVRFVTSAPELACDLVDMELYELAKIAKHEQIPLKSFKFISDNADDSSHQDWKNSLPDAASGFLSIQDDLFSNQTKILILN